MNEVDDVVRLIVGVARLGETDLTGWWGSHGLDRTGSYVLARSFRRTWRSAALELDIEAARRRHDDATAGRSTALHLFSDELPYRRWATAWLAEQKTTLEVSPLFDELASWDMFTAHTSIEQWAGRAKNAEIVGEGVRVGALSQAELDDPAALAAAARRLAGTYLSIDDPFRAPYFDLQG